MGRIIAVTGAIDLVSDGTKCYVIRNGRPEMGEDYGKPVASFPSDDSIYHGKARKKN